MTLRSFFAALALLPALAIPAMAQSDIARNPAIRQGVYAIGLADEVRKNCPELSARLVRAYNFIQSLKSYALQAGYSQAQIDALIQNDAEKDALLREIRGELASRGATPGNRAGYCQVGREEIARNTQAGQLLRGN